MTMGSVAIIANAVAAFPKTGYQHDRKRRLKISKADLPQDQREYKIAENMQNRGDVNFDSYVRNDDVFEIFHLLPPYFWE